MDDLTTSGSFAAEDAAETLIALGWPVEPHGDDSEVWKLGDFILTDAELISLALCYDVRPAPDLIQ